MLVPARAVRARWGQAASDNDGLALMTSSVVGMNPAAGRPVRWQPPGRGTVALVWWRVLVTGGSPWKGRRPVSSGLPPWLPGWFSSPRYARAVLRGGPGRSEEHTSELQSLRHLVC